MTDTATGYDPDEPAPMRHCTDCAPGQVTHERPQYRDDLEGRRAHAKALGHWPRTTEGDPA